MESKSSGLRMILFLVLSSTYLSVYNNLHYFAVKRIVMLPADLHTVDEAAMRILQLMNESIAQSADIERMMQHLRYNLSKTRAIVGYSSSYAMSTLDGHVQLQPSIRVTVSSSGELAMLQKRDGGAQVEEGAWRPFGVLEPTTAKLARAKVREVVERMLEWANTRRRLIELGDEYKGMMKGQSR